MNGDFHMRLLQHIWYQNSTKYLLLEFCLGTLNYVFQLVD